MMSKFMVEIRVMSSKDLCWMKRFEEVEIVPVGEDEFLLKTTLVDQPGLHGLLSRVHDEGLMLVSLYISS